MSTWKMDDNMFLSLICDNELAFLHRIQYYDGYYDEELADEEFDDDDDNDDEDYDEDLF